jgi:hypothetical protein
VPIIPTSGYTAPDRWVSNPPDVELIVARYLRDQLGSDARSYTELPPGETFTTSVVRCQRIGGIFRPGSLAGILDDATVDVDVWSRGDFTTVLKPLVSRVRGLLIPGARGVMYLGGAITNTYEIAGPVRRPEDDPLLGRIGFTVGVVVRPT